VISKCKQGFVYKIKQGEASKNFQNFENILNYLIENKFIRTDCIVAVGGGVVGDLAGFCASVYMRGITFYNIPTTLLSQVDSSVGGKTAIDKCGIKNIVGAFYPPHKVIIDPNVLKTLDNRQLLSGLVEAIKMGATSDKQLFDLIKNSNDLQKDIEHIEQQNIQLAKEASEWKSKYEDFEKNFNLRVKEEKSKLRSRYNEKLTKITEDIENKKNINSEKIDLKKGQPVGKIIEILEGKITFRFDNDSFCKQITNGDKLNVVRNLAGNSVSVGTLEVTNVSPFSTFGRATVDSLKSGMNIHTGDFLVIKNKN
jgi:3-dehydroquinate synthase